MNDGGDDDDDNDEDEVLQVERHYHITYLRRNAIDRYSEER
jgi:hypothetical protein